MGFDFLAEKGLDSGKMMFKLLIVVIFMAGSTSCN